MPDPCKRDAYLKLAGLAGSFASPRRNSADNTVFSPSSAELDKNGGRSTVGVRNCSALSAGLRMDGRKRTVGAEPSSSQRGEVSVPSV